MKQFTGGHGPVTLETLSPGELKSIGVSLPRLPPLPPLSVELSEEQLAAPSKPPLIEQTGSVGRSSSSLFGRPGVSKRPEEAPGGALEVNVENNKDKPSGPD